MATITFRNPVNSIANSVEFNNPANYVHQFMWTYYPSNFENDPLTIQPDPSYPDQFGLNVYGIAKNKHDHYMLVISLTFSNSMFTEQNPPVVRGTVSDSGDSETVSITGGEPLSPGMTPPTLILELELNGDPTIVGNTCTLNLDVNYNMAGSGTNTSKYKFTKGVTVDDSIA
jgi:hypothetical protein